MSYEKFLSYMNTVSIHKLKHGYCWIIKNPSVNEEILKAQEARKEKKKIESLLGRHKKEKREL